MIKTLLAVLALALSTHAARAAVLAIDNFAAGTQSFAANLSGPDAEIFFSPFPNRRVAFSFTTGAVPADLLSLRFMVNVGDPSISPIEATLSTGSPVAGPVSGTSLGSAPPPASSPITQTVEITPPLTITLAPATQYWVHLTVPAGMGIYGVLNSNAPVMEPGWSLGNTWYHSPLDGWLEVNSGPQARIQLNVEPQAVPEPATGLCTLLAAGAVMARGRRTARQPAA